MTNKTQTDYWNEGVKYAREENWKEAIESYENAVKLLPNPALYTNLAACYKNLENFDKEKEYYMLAISGLLNKEYTHTSSPANNAAWYLFENNIELEKAEEIAKSAIEISLESDKTLDTYVNILLKNGKKEEAIRYLAKLKFFYPEHEASKELFTKYENEINKYFEDYWNKNSKEKIAQEILKRYNIPQNEIDFILNGGKYHKTNDFYPSAINAIYQDFKASFIINDDITKRFFQVIFKTKDSYYKKDLINTITKYKDDDASYNKAIDILTNAGIDIISIISTLVFSDYYDKKTEYLIKVLDENIKEKQYSKIIDMIKKLVKIQEFRASNFFTKFLFDKNYDKYLKKVNPIMENIVYYSDISGYLNFLKDDDFIEFIIYRLRNYNNAQNIFDDDFFDAIKLFLENDVITNEFIEHTNKAKSSYHFSGFYSYFVKNIDKKNKFYNKMLRLAFVFDASSSFNNLIDYNGEKFDKTMINTLLDSGLSLLEQLKIYLKRYSDTYSYYKKKWEKHLMQIIQKDFDMVLNELDEISKNKKELSFLIPLLWKEDNDKFYPYLLKLSALNSKQVKEAVIGCLKGYQNGFDDFKTMLKSKKQAERIVGVELLASLNMEEIVVPLLNELLLKEKAQKVKNAINNYFSTIKQNEAENRKKQVMAFGVSQFNKEAEQNKDLNLESINKIKWLNIQELPKLHFKNDNKEISQNLVYSLLNSLIKSRNLKLYYEAERLLSFINKDNIIKFSKSIYDMWKDAKEDVAWVLILLAEYYNDKSVIDELFLNLENSIINKSSNMKKLFTKAIILIGKKEGLRRIAKYLNDNYDSDIDNIYYDLGNKIKDKANLLYDYRMKTFRFNENGEKIVDYGARSFTLKLTPEFKFTVVADNGKSYKNLPKPSKKDDPEIANSAYEDFKLMKKELRDYVKDRKKYLEKLMIDNTKWEYEDWKFIFINNPIINNLSKGLIWDNDGKTFRVMEDNTLADIEDDEYEINKNAKISLIHPIDLTKEDIELWKEQLEDYEITQPFNQLYRFVYTPSDKSMNLTYIDDFNGYMAMRISFRSKLLDKYAWTRGPAEDGGCYYSYGKYLALDLKVQLEFMGECYGGYGDRFQEIWIGKLYFYNTLGKEVKLKDIPKILLSEIYLQVKELADSGSGYNENYLDTEW